MNITLSNLIFIYFYLFICC